MKKRGQSRSQKRNTGIPSLKARSGTKPPTKERMRKPSGKTAIRRAPLIVGIGASAGGLEAFTHLLRALPGDTGMAFVLVQHLEPSRESVLTKLLARATEMPVQEVREGMCAEPNHVYVIPANADLSLMDGLLHVVGRMAPAGHDLPIDYFFRLLAQTLKSRAIGVILSGTAPDGTAGLQAIKAEGGITFAQEPTSAKFDGMPRSAIAAGCVDLILPPDRIAAELARLARHPFIASLPQDVVAALPAKEELRSSNEELITLNEQLENRNAELGRLSDDLTNVLSGVDIPILILGSDRRIRRFTPPAQKLLGLLLSDIGRPLGNLRIGVTIPDLEELIAAVIDQGAEIQREVQSDAGRWHSLRIRPFKTGEQKIEGVLVAFVDIHELKQSRDNLLKERNFISAILDAAKDLLVVVFDREGRIVQFNRVCQQLTGYTLEEVKGRRPCNFLLLPDETPAVKETFSSALDGTPRQSENHWIAKDGRRLLISWSNSTVASDGSVESVIATGIDQTERAEARQRVEESEATIRALLETAAQAILAADEQGQIVLANAATGKMFGYSRDELIGQSVELLVPERLRVRHVNHRADWFSRPRNRPMGDSIKLAGQRKDGTEFPVEIGLSYIESRDGLRAVAFVSDVTERKNNEAILLDYQKQLQRLSAALLAAQETEHRELSRELHDVFSQELAALRMELSTLLQSTDSAGPLKKRLADLGSKIGHLADEMHRTARQLHPAILDELGLEVALREECRTFSEHSGIPVQFTSEALPASLPEEVSLCLYRVTQESLRNVRKHVGATEVRVQLNAVEGGINLRVADTGDGFDVDEARKSGGLGLISMEERARMVNGKFAIHSQPGSGTTVDVFVPLGGEAS